MGKPNPATWSASRCSSAVPMPWRLNSGRTRGMTEPELALSARSDSPEPATTPSTRASSSSRSGESPSRSSATDWVRS